MRPAARARAAGFSAAAPGRRRQRRLFPSMLERPPPPAPDALELDPDWAAALGDLVEADGALGLPGACGHQSSQQLCPKVQPLARNARNSTLTARRVTLMARGDVQLLQADYISAANARIQAARLMYREQRFVDAVYLAGVATECLLRAFALDQDTVFDGRPDLGTLFKTAAIERFVGERQRATMSAHLGNVWSRWKNNYRYIGEERLKA